MALGILLIMFVVFAIVSISGILLLYFAKSTTIKNIVFYFLSMWSMLITFINVTGSPTNFIANRVISLSFGALAVVALFIKIRLNNKLYLCNILVSVSILLGLVNLFFF